MQPSRRSSASQFSCYVWSTIRTLISGKRNHFATSKMLRSVVSYGCCLVNLQVSLLFATSSQAAYEKLLSCSPQSNDFDAARRFPTSATAPKRTSLHKRIHRCFPTGYHRYHNWSDQCVLAPLSTRSTWNNMKHHETTWQDQLLESSYIMSHLVTRGLVKSQWWCKFQSKVHDKCTFSQNVRKILEEFT